MRKMEDEVLQKIQSHKFVVAFTGESPFSEVVQGWDAMLDYIRHEFNGDDDGDFELPEEMFDPDSWRLDGWRLPYIYDSPEIGECCHFQVIRLSEPPAPPKPTPDAMPGFHFRGGNPRCEMHVVPEGGMTKFYDADWNESFQVAGEFDEQTCLQIHRAYRRGFDRGEISGETDLQSQLRELLGVPAK